MVHLLLVFSFLFLFLKGLYVWEMWMTLWSKWNVFGKFYFHGYMLILKLVWNIQIAVHENNTSGWPLDGDIELISDLPFCRNLLNLSVINVANVTLTKVTITSAITVTMWVQSETFIFKLSEVSLPFFRTTTRRRTSCRSVRLIKHF